MKHIQFKKIHRLSSNSSPGRLSVCPALSRHSEHCTEFPPASGCFTQLEASVAFLQYVRCLTSESSNLWSAAWRHRTQLHMKYFRYLEFGVGVRVMFELKSALCHFDWFLRPRQVYHAIQRNFAPEWTPPQTVPPAAATLLRVG